MDGGGRGVYFSRPFVVPGVLSGATTTSGRTTAEKNETIEKMTRDSEPRRPIVPRASEDVGELEACLGASYRK